MYLGKFLGIVENWKIAVIVFVYVMMLLGFEQGMVQCRGANYPPHRHARAPSLSTATAAECR